MINKTQMNKLLVEERKKARQKQKQSEFMRRTLSIYKGQQTRIYAETPQKLVFDIATAGLVWGEGAKAGKLWIPFSLEEFREWLSPFVDQLCGCGKKMTIKVLAVDHKVPISRGGSFRLENLQAMCKSCNYRKGKFLPDEFTKLVRFAHEELSAESREDLWRRLTSGGKMMFGR